MLAADQSVNRVCALTLTVRYRDHAFRRPNRAKLTKQLAKIQAQKHLNPNEADQCAQNQFSERGFYDSEFKAVDVKR